MAEPTVGNKLFLSLAAVKRFTAGLVCGLVRSVTLLDWISHFNCYYLGAVVCTHWNYSALKTEKQELFVIQNRSCLFIGFGKNRIRRFRMELVQIVVSAVLQCRAVLESST